MNNNKRLEYFVERNKDAITEMKKVSLYNNDIENIDRDYKKAIRFGMEHIGELILERGMTDFRNKLLAIIFLKIKFGNDFKIYLN